MRQRVHKKRGSILLMFYLMLVVFISIGHSMFGRVAAQKIVVQKEIIDDRSFRVAEAGLERMIHELREDYVNAPSSTWFDGDINGTAFTPTSNFTSFPLANNSIMGGTYTVDLKSVSGEIDKIRIRSTSNYQTTVKSIEVILQAKEVSVWDNAIFAGRGSSSEGSAISGNVSVGGSITILGTGLSPTDYAIDATGGAKLAMNYCDGLTAAVQVLIPSLPQTNFNGEIIGSLGASLRVGQGQVGLSGSAKVGMADLPLNLVKETTDGVYVTDGFGGNKGAVNVYSDNGSSQPYDLGNLISFPDMTASYGSESSYENHLKSVGYTLTAAEASALSSLKPNSSFNYGDANGRITMNGLGSMTIDGVVVIDNGGDLNIDKQGPLKTIAYSGSGILYVSGNVSIKANLLTSGIGSFPTNIMGIVTPNDITFNRANIAAMGLFFADGEVQIQKQTEVIGSVVSNYFDMGTNTPSICYVPELIDNLPDDMLGEESLRWVEVTAWMEE